jgi:hypothetical protein
MATGRTLLAVLVLLGCGDGTGPSSAASITLSVPSAKLVSLGDTLTLSATVVDASGSVVPDAAVTWRTNASWIATVSTSGLVRAVQNGFAVITASAGSTQTQASIAVEQAASTLLLSPDTLRIWAYAGTATIRAMVLDANGQAIHGAAVAYASDDPGVATVDALTGRVTVVSNGATTLVAETPTPTGTITGRARLEIGHPLPRAVLTVAYPGVPYASRIVPDATPTALTYAVTGGVLPDGLTFDVATTEVVGTPTGSGAFFFEVTGSSGSTTMTERYGIAVSTKPPSEFNLSLAYDGGVVPSAGMRDRVSAAFARIEEIVTQDSGPTVDLPRPEVSMGCFLAAAGILEHSTIDDMAILLAVDSAAGPGGIAARAGPCAVEVDPDDGFPTGRTVAGHVRFYAEGWSDVGFQSILTHELLHALGIGSWATTTVGTQDVRFFGPTANAEWRALGGPFDGVPLDPWQGAHLSEAWFDDELMTTGNNDPVPLISRVTIGALIDLGWVADLNAADAYALRPCAGACSSAPRASAADP